MIPSCHPSLAAVPPVPVRSPLRLPVRQLYRLRPEDLHLPLCLRGGLQELAQVVGQER